MKKISILVPEPAVMQAIADRQYLISAAKQFLVAAEKKPLFEVKLVGATPEVPLNFGAFSVKTDRQITDFTRTDLVIVPAFFSDMASGVARNQNLVPWILRQYAQGAEVASLCVGAFLLASTGLLDGKKCSTHRGFPNSFFSRTIVIKIMKFLRFHLLLLTAFFFAKTTLAQPVIYGTNRYIAYQKGTLPIVLSVPHGGAVAPTGIPDRTCNSPTTVTDANTIDLANNISTALFNRTGCYPHIIYCNLKRTKLDCNRNLADAACGNAAAETAWHEFHNFIDTAQQIASDAFEDNIFYVDLHGHGHPIQRIELGYLLRDYELELPDSVLNTAQYLGYSSIKNIAANNQNNYQHAELLRGSAALGTLLGNKNYPAVPSQQIPAPGTMSNYFSGGYNTANHTCYTAGNTVNGVQMECNYTGIRDNAANRQAFGNSLAVVLLNYLYIHRNVSVAACTPLLGIEAFANQDALKIYPNPVPFGNRIITIEGLNKVPMEYELLNFLGQLCSIGPVLEGKILLEKPLAAGIYGLRIFDKKNMGSSKKITTVLILGM